MKTIISSTRFFSRDYTLNPENKIDRFELFITNRQEIRDGFETYIKTSRVKILDIDPVPLSFPIIQ